MVAQEQTPALLRFGFSILKLPVFNHKTLGGP